MSTDGCDASLEVSEMGMFLLEATKEDHVEEHLA